MTRLHSLIAALAVMAGALAHAETHRLAVVVGNNAGSGEMPALRYAEADAGKVARVLAELGSVSADNIYLLQGKGLGGLQEALALVQARVERLRRNPDARVVVLFYYSGHSDGQALELGTDRLTFADLRRWLDSTQAEVRLAIVDSCKSGALLTAKGGRKGPAFQIRLADELAATGQALLTSSASDELALESQELRGSYFTHHLVSGLRGAADASGDGQVTLGEVYQYAYARTVAATSNTVVGPQHPVYDYRLSGQGELVLSELQKPSAAIEVPPGYERVLVIHPLRDQVVSELSGGAGLRVALVPGEYAVRAWRGGQSFGARFRIAQGQVRQLRADELPLLNATLASAKGSTATAFLPIEPATPLPVEPAGGEGGGEVRTVSAGGLDPIREAELAAMGGVVPQTPLPATEPPARLALFASLGARNNLPLQDGLALSGRLVLSAPGVPWVLAGDVSMLRVGATYNETVALAYLGYRLPLLDAEGWTIALGLEGGAGAVIAFSAQGSEGRLALGAAAVTRVSYAVTPKLKLALEAQLPLLYALGAPRGVAATPAAFLGAELGW